MSFIHACISDLHKNGGAWRPVEAAPATAKVGEVSR
jgi:hypothetical protein